MTPRHHVIAVTRHTRTAATISRHWTRRGAEIAADIAQYASDVRGYGLDYHVQKEVR